MSGVCAMQLVEIPGVVSEDGTAEQHGVRENVRIGDALVGPARRQRGEHVVACRSKKVGQRLLPLCGTAWTDADRGAERNRVPSPK